MRCHTRFENEDMIKAATMMTKPTAIVGRRILGHRWRMAKLTGAPRYMIPIAVVPITAMPEGSDENGSCVV